MALSKRRKLRAKLSATRTKRRVRNARPAFAV